MSDLDFEAIGRCKHIGEQLGTALRDRHMAFSRMSSLYKANGHGQVGDSVTTTDISAMQKHFDELKLHEQKILELVAEYNEWAPRANVKTIRLSKH